MRTASIAIVLTIAFLYCTTPARAQQQETPRPDEPGQAALFKQFEQMLSDAVLIGRFTTLGKKGILPREEYTIKSVQKLPMGDFWLFQARIKYGDTDITLPVPVEVKWAGDTPVITLTDVTIPGLGTFGARVVIHAGKYAGTWRHGDAGGHMFGVIKKVKETPDESAQPNTSSAE